MDGKSRMSIVKGSDKWEADIGKCVDTKQNIRKEYGPVNQRSNNALGQVLLIWRLGVCL
jgi:hypothetical protein